MLTFTSTDLKKKIKALAQIKQIYFLYLKLNNNKEIKKKIKSHRPYQFYLSLSVEEEEAAGKKRNSELHSQKREIGRCDRFFWANDKKNI